MGLCRYKKSHSARRETARKSMYRCISLSREYPEGKIEEKEPHYRGRAETPKEAFVIIVIIINGKEFGRIHQF